MLATKGVQQDVRSVGRTLGVDTVPQGHLRRAEGRLMLMVELCRVSDGSILLSREWLPEDKDLRPVQADLVRDTLQALRVDTGTEPSKSALHTHTNNPMVYEEFLWGDAVGRGDLPAELHEAVRHFEKATAIGVSGSHKPLQRGGPRLVPYLDRPQPVAGC